MHFWKEPSLELYGAQLCQIVIRKTLEKDEQLPDTN